MRSFWCNKFTINLLHHDANVRFASIVSLMSTLEIRKQTTHMGMLIIRPVSKTLAKDLIIRNHYSHKWNTPFGLYNFGIFKETAPDECLGVAVYGWPKCPRAKNYISDVPNGWMCELNRMWIDDVLGKNAETILISASLKLLRLFDSSIVAVQSFADGRLGCGTIYKASNFQYYGYHITRFFRDKKTGEIFHEQDLSNSACRTRFLRKNIDLLLGQLECFDTKTYRYIYPFHRSFTFTGAKRKPYPPYEKGTTPGVEKIKPDHLVGRLTTVLKGLAEKYPHQ